MDTTSRWQGTSLMMACQPTLQADITVDVATVGAGITGLAAAMQLAAAGKLHGRARGAARKNEPMQTTGVAP